MQLKRLNLSTLAIAIILSSPASAQDRGYGNRDDVALLTTNGFLDSRDDLSPDIFRAYWRDLHGPLGTRIDGIHQYWQHHLGNPDPALLPDLGAVDVSPSDDERVEGISETTFAAASDRDAMGDQPAAGLLFEDERNVFRATYLHRTVSGNTRTHVDRLEDAAPLGTPDVFRVLLMLRADDGIERSRFRERMMAEVIGPLASDDSSLKVRSHLFEAYDPAAWDTPDVENDWSQSQAYDAQIELAFRSRAEAIRILALVRGPLSDTGMVQAVHAYPVENIYTLVYDGRPTLAGLRGVPILETIRAVGADNQVTLPVLKAMYGSRTQEPTR